MAKPKPKSPPPGGRPSATARRAEAQRLQREQERRERRRTLIGTGVIAVVLVGLVIAVVVGVRGSQSEPTPAGPQIVPTTPTGKTTVQPEPAKVDNPTDIEGVLAWDTKGYPAPGSADAGTLGHDHVQGPVKYAVLPPVGGPHNGVWMNAGIYTKPVPSERAVHDLEHGAVWITYDPSLADDQVAALESFVEDQSMIDEGNGQANRFMILSPWADGSLPSPIVASAWGYQLRLDDASDDRLKDFVDTFRHSQTYSPEYGSAVDGIPTGTGGNPAAAGSKLANPTGTVDGQGM